MKLFIKRISGAILASLLVISLSVSCQRERFGENAPSDPDVVRLSFSVLPNTDGPFTRSSISSDTDKLDTTVNDMNIWIYRDGLLYRQIYRTTTADTTMKLDSSSGHTYHIFALANVGKRTPQIKLTDLRDFDKFYLDSITVDYMTEHGLPMAYEADLTFGTATHQVLLKRYVARYDFRIDRSHMKGSFTVKSVALCQSRNIFNPFYTGKQFATATDQVEKGDSSSTADVTALNNGNRVVFYALQNKHGELLRGNTDPWKKIPNSLTLGNDKLCTYIHLKGTYKDSVLSREMDYRFYLGKDAVEDFTVEENTRYTVTFFPSDSSTTKLGNWKVEGYKPGETDPREIKIADGAFKSGDTLEVAVSTDTALAFSANCSVDTLVKLTASGFRYEFKKAAANSDAVDSLKIFVDTTATVEEVDSLVFGTFDKKKTFTINVKAIQGGPAPIPPLLPVEFTVNDAGKKVVFTRGNLYYDSSKSKWHLEDQQYYTPANGTWSTDHIAHFWFSKSASIAYANAYSDASAAVTDSMFCAEGHELTAEDTAGLYSLSQAEWTYLATDRPNASSLQKIGVTVCGVPNCAIIAPDDYSGTLKAEYDDAAWLTAQADGLVCLPPAGARNGSTITGVDSVGGFWISADPSNVAKACGFAFTESASQIGSLLRNLYASSVRLVKTTYTPPVPLDPVLNGLFSVSATKRVKFTRGNLYRDSTNHKWCLEAQQYDTVARGTWNLSHIAHFYYSKNVSTACGQQWAEGGSATVNDKLFCSVETPLSIESESGLYVLTKAEWDYLVNSRTGSTSKYKFPVTVCGINCLVIAPDDFTGTIAASYDASSWATAQSNDGLVCLPCAGARDGTNVKGVNQGGNYNTSTPSETSNTLYYAFSYNTVTPHNPPTTDSYGRGNAAFSIRLVQTGPAPK